MNLKPIIFIASLLTLVRCSPTKKELVKSISLKQDSNWSIVDSATIGIEFGFLLRRVQDKDTIEALGSIKTVKNAINLSDSLLEILAYNECHFFCGVEKLPDNYELKDYQSFVVRDGVARIYPNCSFLKMDSHPNQLFQITVGSDSQDVLEQLLSSIVCNY